MQQRFAPYRVLSRLYESDRTIVVAARRQDDGASVVLKAPQPGQRGDELESRYAREAEYRLALGQGDVLLERRMGLPLLVIREDARVALRDMVKSSGAVDLSTWLKIALSASRQLKRLHALGVVHRDLHPGNVLWSKTDEHAALVDFELAVPLIHAGARANERHRLEGALPYLAPEATGRMNIGVDERSDLYALGATLYELIVGERAFTASDPLELVHQHMTQAPTPPQECRSEIPAVVSAILLKLLEKSPERRYQSARGLEYDLARAQEQWMQPGKMADFGLGSRDIPDHYRPGKALFGRDADRAALLEGLEQVRGGASLLYVLGGYSGIGKTALARQLREPALLAGGIYAEGKCDQYQRLQPYTAWTGALDSAVSQLLAQPRRQREAAREAIQTAVGSNGRLLTDLVPALEELLGPQADVSALGPREAQNRLSYVFVAFLSSLAAAAPPLVIFLDDLQWMDSASLDLLQAIAQSADIRQLLVVGAYRDNEVAAAHPLHRALSDLSRSVPQRLRTRTLGNLSVADIGAMIAGNLNMEPAAADQLAAAVHARTAGNPFFSHQLLKTLADMRALRFDEAQLQWTWSPERVNAMPLVDNVVDLLLERLGELPPRTQEMLQLGACIGNRFGPGALATAAECSQAHAEAALVPALKERLLVHEEQLYSFGHDRVQQAAYNLVPANARAALHLRIGRLLLAAQQQPIPRPSLFAIVGHFEHGLDSLTEAGERRQIMQLMADAARIAQAASAHDVAVRYYRMALQLAGDAGWQANPEGHWDLYLDAIQSEFNNAHHDVVEQMIATAARHVRSRLDRVRLYELECQFAIARNDQNAAIALALQALELLGKRFASDAQGLAEQATELRGTMQLTPEDIAALADQAEMSDPEQLAAMRVMVSAAGAAYVMRPALWEVLTLQLVQTTLRHGSSPLAAFAYGFYGVLLAGVYQAIDTGYAFGRLSTQLLEHYGAEPLRAKIINLFDVFVRHWKEHLRESIEELPRGLQSGIDSGDFEYGSYNAIQDGKHRVLCGDPLDEVVEKQDAYIQVIERLKMGYHLDFARIWRQLALNLSGRAADPLVLRGEDYDAAALIPRLLAQSSNFLVFNIYCTQAMLAYLLGRAEEALAAADAAVEYAHYVPGMAEIAQHNFFHSLCLLAALRPGQPLHNRKLLRRVAHNQRQLDFWARHAPMNFRHKWQLVEAERLRRSSTRPERAAQRYEEAILGARENWYLNDQALAAELYGEFLCGQGRAFLGASLVREALGLYRNWGAHEKVRQLRTRHGELLHTLDERESFQTTDTDSVINFDVVSALRASLAIANETGVEALKRELMRIVAESAGAQRGLLVLQGERGWLRVAEFDKTGVHIAESELQALPDVPQTVLAHVLRQQQTLLLEDAAGTHRFERDPYLSRHGVRSVLCVPLIHADEAAGALYLENRSVPRAFSPSTAKVVEILAAQASVAIEKARLLETLEHRVESRTRELQRAKRDLEQANATLASSEERFRLAMRGTSEGLFDWNLASGELFLAPGWKRMLGYADHELPNAYETWRQLVDPAQRDTVLDAMDKQLAGPDDSFELEHRLQHRDGHWVQVITRAAIVRDDDGVAVRVVGSNVDVTAERKAQAVIEHQALHDPLTGLPNRALFSDRLNAALKELHRNGTPFALHLLDLDKFKQRNDSLGHQAGDEILRQTARRLSGELRETDTAARLGGDEFAVIQAGVRQEADARQFANKLIARISAPIVLEDDVTTDVGCSIGIRPVFEHVPSMDALMNEADIALDRSKDAGRGTATTFFGEMHTQADRSAQLLRDLPAALKGGEIYLVYQPVYYLGDGSLAGLECLLRWRHPRHGVLAAADFVDAAEDHGLAIELNRWVLAAAIDQMATWEAEGRAFGQLSVNLAIRHKLRKGFAQQLLSEIATHSGRADQITFEFSEALFALDPDLVRQELSSLSNAGVRLAIQGIGTNLVPLNLIRQWHIAELKLAPELAREMLDNETSRTVVRAIVAMSQVLGTSVTATGVECREAHDAVASLGCTAEQGNFIAKPATDFIFDKGQRLH